jgi:hypothetical protein
MNAGSAFPLPVTTKKGEAQTERDKIAARLTASQLIEAQNRVEGCIAYNNYDDLD